MHFEILSDALAPVIFLDLRDKWRLLDSWAGREMKKLKSNLHSGMEAAIHIYNYSLLEVRQTKHIKIVVGGVRMLIIIIIISSSIHPQDQLHPSTADIAIRTSLVTSPISGLGAQVCFQADDSQRRSIDHIVPTSRRGREVQGLVDLRKD